jgi:signal transduction histidine kinase
MDRLITAILGFSRISRAPLERGKLNLSDLAETVTSELARSYPATVASIQPNLIVQADPALLRVVLTNLLDNAYKFSTKSSPAQVDVGRAELPGAPIFIRDNGVGFEPQFAEKIFEPFERLYPEDEFPGTGIGLFNVRRIVDRHRGQDLGRVRARRRSDVLLHVGLSGGRRCRAG